MNVVDVRDALDDLAGPVQVPTRAQRAAVDRRVRRSRLIRVTGAAALVLMGVVGGALVTRTWSNDHEPTQVVTSAGTTIHDEQLGYTVTVPPGWVRDPVHLNPGDKLPSILRLNHDYKQGVIGEDCATSGAQVGVHIGVQEDNLMRPAQPRSTPPLRRPAVIGPDSDGGLRISAYPPVCGRLEQTLMFEDEGRRFFVAITMAADTGQALQAETYEILNSLRFDRGTFVEKVRSDTTATTVTTTVSTEP
jgi:hypothetical protein